MASAVNDAGARQRYALISADTHAGASIQDYKAYLPAKWHDEFDAWSSSFSDAWGDIDGDGDENLRLGTSSFMSPVNWDSDRRVRDLESNGIVAEVIFPNTVPPFYPSGSLTAAAPQSREEYAARWAGIQAHNRWLADFCAQTPNRRAGIAQIFLDDVDQAVAEVRWAKEHGLRGVLLPGDHHARVVNVYYPKLDALWQVCEELAMPIHRHGAVVAEAEGPETGVASPAIGLLEAGMFGQRVYGQLVLAGVFDRFPGLQLVFAETRIAWIPTMLANLDGYVRQAGYAGSITNMFAGKAVARLERLPSEYFPTNCHAGTFFADNDVDVFHQLGVDRLMWGADYPHHEGTWPHTSLAIRRNFASVPEHEVRQLTSINAATLYDLDLEYLQSLADRVGPTPDEVAVPLDVADFPDSPCPSFDARFVA